MPKSSAPPSLNLSAAKVTAEATEAEISQPRSPSTLSPISPRSPMSHPGSPCPQQYSERSLVQQETEATSRRSVPNSPTITAIPQCPPSPLKPSSKPGHGREPSKSFFSNLMASKSSHRLQAVDQNRTLDHSRTELADSDSIRRGRASSKDGVLQSLKSKASASDLGKNYKATEIQREHSPDRKMSGSDTSSQPPEGSILQNVAGKKSKRFALLRSRSTTVKTDDAARGKSVKTDDSAQAKLIKTDDPARAKSSMPKRLDLSSPTNRDPQFSEPIKTAPLRNDRRERVVGDSIGSAHRNRSAGRPSGRRDGSQEKYPPRNSRAGGSLGYSNSFKEGAGAHLLSNLHQTGRGAADKLGKAGKGFLGRITRSGSSHEREVVTDDNYTCSTINLPLVTQTRRTRIARRLELSKDKTEFWMPALPWRCIDYLNMNGCEEEGLYRIPGSGREVKHWQRRFDVEDDINLFDEPELYDINTIGSMFKAWLRDLPDEILPKQVQIKVAEQCMGATKTPQLLRDELSKLPPFNYYLLFAITCHLSLLHSFADKNKMDYRNLCICFQPCLRIDGFCFQFLVQDWKNCWQGCWTEKEYLLEEYRIQAEGEDAESQSAANEYDDRAVSSSSSSQHLATIPTQSQQQPPLQNAPTLVRKAVPNGPQAASSATPANTNGSDNASNGNNTQSSIVSTEDQQSTSTRTSSEPESSRSKSDVTLPTLNLLSPIKL